MDNFARTRSQKNRAGRRDTTFLHNTGRKVMSLLLALCLALALVPAVPRAAAADPDPSDRVQSSLDKLVEWGVMRGGDANGGLYPNRSLTRSEFAALVNRAYGYTKVGPTPFTDVSPREWYADDIAIAYNAGYFQGTSATTAGPKTTLTREQAAVLLARSLRLQEVPGQVAELSDGDQVSDWARGYIRACAQGGIIDDNDGSGYRPKDLITRAEMAELLAGCVGNLVQTPGEHTLGNVYGNVTINKSGTTLKDTVIAGDLYVTGGVDLGAITLDNVTVLGKVVVAGGGESEKGGDSVLLRNVEAQGLVLDSINNQYNSLRAEGDTSIQDTILRTSAYLQDRTDAGYGFLNLVLDSKTPDAAFTLSGNLKDVINKTPGSSLIVADATADSLTIDELAAGSTLRLDADTVVRQLNLDTGTEVTGVGDIDRLQVNTLGSSVEMLPDKVDIRPGLIASVAGEDMDPSLARETSTDPRLLAGYPKVKKVASTTATAVFSTNKPGTVYWAVSTVADGSISEGDLIEPGEYSNRALQQDSVKVDKANTEVTADIKDLTRSGTYYLSAIFVDAQGKRSPVKVTSFSTPDDSVPAFAQGYPKMSRISIQPGALQAMVMTTKTCNLYWVLLPTGSTTPTPNDFRVNAFNANNCLGYSKSPVEITRNMERKIINLNNVGSEKLKELTNYDLYFWLDDIDGVKCSAVIKTTFRTEDETPPEFKHSITGSDGKLTITAKTGTSITGEVVVNEDATVYWAVVTAGTPFPLDSKGGLVKDMNSKDAQTAVKSGFGSLKHGQVGARKDAKATISITGLQSGRSYDIYYVAEDKANPVPLFSTVEHLDDQHTLDTEPPTVSQDFSKKNDLDQPYPDGDVYVIFSEDVMKAPIPGEEPGESLLALSKAGDKDKLAELLRNTIKLYDDSKKPPELVKDKKDATGDDWVIDYTAATISRDIDPESSAVIVTFKGGTAIKLGSGNSYHFEINSISDTSDSHNLLNKGKVYPLPQFTVVPASIQLRELDFFGTKSIYTEVDKNGKPVYTESDSGFSFTPISTGSAPESARWDLVFRSNMRVEFDLYTREGDTGAWTKIGTTHEITENSGLSLSKDFKGASDFPFLRNLNEDSTIQYGIQIKKIKGNTTRTAWSDKVEFTVSVVTGANIDLLELSGNIVSKYGTLVGNGKKLTEISDPGSLLLSMPFSNDDPPALVEDYPRFDPTASSVTVSVTTDVSANLHWMLAEVSDSGELDNNNKKIMSSVVRTYAISDHSDFNYDFTTDILDFSKVKERGVAADNNKKKPEFELASPGVSDIDDRRPSAGVQRGVAQTKGNERVLFTINGLNDDQDYYFYFYLEAGRESKVYIYKFKTNEKKYPIVFTEWGLENTADIRITNQVDADVDYMLFDHISSKDTEFTTWLTEAGGFNEPANSSYTTTTMSILTALHTPYSATGCSLFDQYATATAKETLWTYLHGSVQQNTIVGKTTGQSYPIRGQYEGTVSCTDPKDWDRLSGTGMQPGLQYTFFAFAYLPGEATGGEVPKYSAYCVTNLTLVDQNPPTAVADFAFGDEVTDASGALTAYKGFTLSLMFDRPLYAQDPKDNKIYEVDPAKTDSDTDKIAAWMLGHSAGGVLEISNSKSTKQIITLAYSSNIPVSLSTSTTVSYSFSYSLCDKDGRAAAVLPVTLQLQVKLTPRVVDGEVVGLNYEVTAPRGAAYVVNLPLSG